MQHVLVCWRVPFVSTYWPDGMRHFCCRAASLRCTWHWWARQARWLCGDDGAATRHGGVWRCRAVPVAVLVWLQLSQRLAPAQEPRRSTGDLQGRSVAGQGASSTRHGSRWAHAVRGVVSPLWHRHTCRCRVAVALPSLIASPSRRRRLSRRRRVAGVVSLCRGCVACMCHGVWYCKRRCGQPRSVGKAGGVALEQMGGEHGNTRA